MQNNRSSDNEVNLSYTRLIQEEQERQLQLQLQTLPFTQLSKYSQSRIKTFSQENMLLDTIVSQNGPKIKIHYYSQQNSNTNLQENIYQKSVSQCTKQGFVETKIEDQQRLEQIQQKQQPRQESLQKEQNNEILQSKIVKRIKIENPCCPNSDKNIETTNHQQDKAKQNLILKSSPVNIYIRAIEDSIQLEDPQQKMLLDRETLKIPTNLDNKQVHNSSQQQRQILSSLVTSKNRQFSNKKIDKSIKQLILRKINNIQKLVKEQVQRRKNGHNKNIKNTSYQFDFIDLELLQKLLFLPAWKELPNCHFQKSYKKWKTIISQLGILTKQHQILLITHNEVLIDIPQQKLVCILRGNYLFFGMIKNDGNKIRGLEIFYPQYAYLGSFASNYRNQKGICVFQDESWYKGQWAKGKFNGFGIFHSKNGGFYEGYFQMGQKNGIGQQLFPNGDRYVGKYRGNLFHGEGKYNWLNGSSYEGHFEKGMMHGQGFWRSINGDEYRGAYYNGLKQGVGSYKWANGKIFNGIFKKGKKIQSIQPKGNTIKKNLKNIS